MYMREDVLQNLHQLITQLGVTSGLTTDCLNLFVKDGSLNVQTNLNHRVTQA